MPAMSVLVVDDEPGVREICSRGLDQLGYTVYEASCGRAAIDLATRRHFDLLLVDIKMPGMDGLDTFRAIKALQPDIVGIVMTAYASVDNAVKAVNSGLSGFILKPFRMAQLQTSIRQALAKRQQELELARAQALAPLADLGASLGAHDWSSAMSRIVDVVAEQMACSGVTLAVFAAGSRTPERQENRGTVIECPAEWLTTLPATGRLRLFGANERLDPVNERVLRAAGLEWLAAARLPLPQGSTALLCAGWARNSGSISSDRFEMLRALAAQAAIVLSNLQLFQHAVNAERLQQTMQSYLSPRTVAAVLHGEPTPGIVERSGQMSVLLADVCDFSGLVERTDVHQMIQVLHEFFCATVEIITAEHGVVDELSGDEVLATFDRVHGAEGDALRAVRAALAMLTRLDELRAEWARRDLPQLDIGIGISSGLVSISSIGAGGRRALVTAGRILNLAARSQALTREMGPRLIVTKETFEQVQGHVEYEALGAVQLKGFAEPVDLYGITGLCSEEVAQRATSAP